jgi:hypothetical protein
VFCRIVAFAAALSFVYTGPVLAGPIDPQGLETLDVGTDNLYLMGADPLVYCPRYSYTYNR